MAETGLAWRCDKPINHGTSKRYAVSRGHGAAPPDDSAILP